MQAIRSEKLGGNVGLFLCPMSVSGTFETCRIKVGHGGVIRSNHALIIDLAMKYKLPSIFSDSEFAVGGGLLSYGPDYPSLYVRAANILDKVLRGARPADIPIELPTRFDLVINLKTAKTLGCSGVR